MIPLFSERGLEELRRVSRSRALYAFDFDGTLAPIVASPGAAKASADVLQSLSALAERAPVAVVSGRARADLVERLPSSIRHLIGNHGNEGFDDPAVTDRRAICRRWASMLERELATGDADGVHVEDKGVSLSLHYRAASDPAAARARLQRLIARLQPAADVIGGKFVLNLLPPGSITKLEALLQLAAQEQVDTVLFAGDDDTDERVFERAPDHWVTVRVEPDGSSAARYFIETQAEVQRVLNELVRSEIGGGQS